MSDLLELAVRCEAVTGPDRELDRDIMLAAVPCDRAPFRYWAPMNENTGHGAVDVGRVYYGPHCAQAVAVPEFTASLDAAMTLVPEDCLFTVRTVWDKMKPAGLGFVSRYEKGEFGGHERLYWMDEHQAVAATPALALCAAALHARNSLPTAAPAGSSSSPASLHSLGTGAAEATGGAR